MNWAEVLGGLLAHDVIQATRQQRRDAEMAAAGWMPPAEAGAKLEATWQATEDLIVDGWRVTLESARQSAAAARSREAGDSILIHWARDAVPRLATLKGAFDDLILHLQPDSQGVWGIACGASATIQSAWLPGAKHIATAAGPLGVDQGVAEIGNGIQQWTDLQQEVRLLAGL